MLKGLETHDGSKERPLTGVVGGNGQMGRWFARFLTEQGRAVLISDRDTRLTNRELAAQCEIVVVCVPIRSTPAVLEEISAAVGRNALIVSTASLMLPCLPVLRSMAAETVCLHPLFGPSTTTADGQIVVRATVRDGPLGQWLTAKLVAAGARVQEMAPQDHDRAMASVQVTQHTLFVATARALARGGLTASEAVDVSTPTFRLFLALAARILFQQADLYGDIVTLNVHSLAALDGLQAAIAEIRACVEGGDVGAFERLFADARAYFEASPELIPSLIASAEHSLQELRWGG